MNRSKILKYGPWILAPLIGAAAMVAFLILHDRGGGTLEPPPAAGQQEMPGTPVAGYKIQAALDFKGFPLYWLGDSFDSLNLWYLERETLKNTDIDRFDFIYGTCDPSEGGCAPPLDVQMTPLCWNPPESLLIPESDLYDFRGAKAIWRKGNNDGLRIWTGDTAIVLWGYPPERVQQAADALVPLGNIEFSGADSELPPPNFDSCPEIPIYPTNPPVPTPHATPVTATP